MSRAFVKETDSEVLNHRENAEHYRNLEDWLSIQKKKLAVLKDESHTNPKLSREKRLQWIESIEKNIAETELKLTKEVGEE